MIRMLSTKLFHCLEYLRVILIMAIGVVIGTEITRIEIGSNPSNNYFHLSCVNFIILAIISLLIILGYKLQENAIAIYKDPPVKLTIGDELFLGWGNIIINHPLVYKNVIGSIILLIISLIVGILWVYFIG